MPVNMAIFGVFLGDCGCSINEKPCAAMGERQGATIAQAHLNRPSLLTFLSPVKFGGHIKARERSAAHDNVRCDRRIAVLRKQQVSLMHKHRFGQNFDQNGERIDAGVEYAKAAGQPYPFLPRMPAPHIFFPDDGDLCRLARF